jgi:phosphatidylinositol alpha-mannosyltransferase
VAHAPASIRKRVTPVRVALISPYALSVYGGVQEQTLAMSRELARRGHEVLVVTPDGNDRERYDTPATIARFGWRLSLPANGSKAPLTLSPLAVRRAWFAVQSFKPDVVHFHEPFAPFIGWGVLRTHFAPAVATFHRGGGGPALTLTKPLLRLLSKDLDVTAAVSGPAASTVHAACGLSPTVLFNGLEVDRYESFPRTRSDEIVLVTVGRLEQRKGTVHAIRAVLAHNNRGADQWRLVVIGDGARRASLEALSDGTQIQFLGALDDEQKRAWLRRANVVLCPALSGESFGLVLLEAMASESSVVASDISGYREASGGLATLFEPGNDESLERAIVGALAHETQQSIAAGRVHAQRWSMATLVDEYEKLYGAARERFDVGK